MLERMNGMATISRESEEISEIFRGMGFNVSPLQIRDRICEGDVLNEVDELNRVTIERWIEATDRRPGDLQDHPWLVLCSLSVEPGSATNRTYIAL